MTDIASSSLNIESLKESNYYGWKTNMKATLKLKDLWGPVEQTDAWWAMDESVRSLIDDKARSLMLLCITPTLRTLISGSSTAKHAWDTLERVFHARSAGRKFGLRTQLHELKRGKSEGVLVYVARAEQIRTELLEACDEDVSEDVMVHALLSGLGKAYETFVRQVRFGTEDMTLDMLKSRLLTVESEVKRADRGEFDATALALEAHRPKFLKNQQKWKKGACHHCGRKGHWKRECPGLKKEAASTKDAVALVCQAVNVTTDPDRMDYGRGLEMFRERRAPIPPRCSPAYMPSFQPSSSEEAEEARRNGMRSSAFPQARAQDLTGESFTLSGDLMFVVPDVQPITSLQDNVVPGYDRPRGGQAGTSRGKHGGHGDGFGAQSAGVSPGTVENLNGTKQQSNLKDFGSVYALSPELRKEWMHYELEMHRAERVGPNWPGIPFSRPLDLPNIDEAVICEIGLEVGCGADDDISIIRRLVIDSGATHHVFYDKSMFDPDGFDEKIQDWYVRTGGGEKHAVKGRGKVVLHSPTEGGEFRALVLHSALYVPTMQHCIFSVFQAAERGARTVFADSTVTVEFLGSPVLQGTQLNGMYVAPTVICERYNMLLPIEADLTALSGPDFTSCMVVTFERWHQRLGHPAHQSMKAMIENECVEGLNCKEQTNTTPFEVCLRAKQHRATYTTSESCAVVPLELVHADTMGPIKPKSIGGSKYVLVVLDDFSRYSECRFLESKADIGDALLDVLTHWERQCGRVVKALRTDRGTEFCNEALEDVLNSKGIQHQLSVRYTPQQNGRVERVNRTLMDRTRALIIQSNAPKRLWAEALSTANMLRNVVPVLKRTKTPYQMFKGTKPDLSMLKVFGSKAYVHVPKEKRKKLDERCVIGMMVGVSKNSKAWRIAFSQSDGSITVEERADVVFDESVLGVLRGCGAVTDSELVELGFSVNSLGENGAPTLVPIAEESGAGVLPGTQDPQADNAENEMNEEDEQPANDEENLAEEGNEEQEAEAIIPADEPQQPIRRSGRASARPWRPYDGYINVTEGGVKLRDDPKSLSEVQARPDWPQFREAMQTEQQALLENATYTVVKEVPAGRKALPTMWAFKVKRDEMGRIIVYRARAVIRGDMQTEGIDFGELYAPVSRHSTLRVLLTVVCEKNYDMHLLDVRTAFLNADLDEEVYVRAPPGIGLQGQYWKLRKAMNGLRQSPRAWYKTLREALTTMGFSSTAADTSLYVKENASDRTYVLVYVDDLLIVGASSSVMRVKQQIAAKFSVKDAGEATYFLGMTIKRDREEGTLWVGQPSYAREILQRFGMQDCKPRRTPLDTSIRLSKLSGYPDESIRVTYQELVGALLYLSNCTRPDLTHAIGMLARFMSAPTNEHMQSAKQVLRYLAGTLDLGIQFNTSDSTGNSSEGTVVGYSDADYAGDPDKRKSTSGNVFLRSGGAISWSSKLQPTVAASTCEAEFIAAAAAVKEALWIKNLLSDMQGKTESIEIKVDNQGALKLLHHPHAHQRTKHIDIAHRFVQDRVERGELVCSYVSTNEMAADCLTKAVPLPQFQKNKAVMGLVTREFKL
jgi:hypothetical protein